MIWVFSAKQKLRLIYCTFAIFNTSPQYLIHKPASSSLVFLNAKVAGFKGDVAKKYFLRQI